MLSCMDTDRGLMIFGPGNQPLRVNASSPSITAARELLRQKLPAEQAWSMLMALVENPLLALVSWCERFGISLTEELQPEGEFLVLGGRKLSKSKWLPLLQRTYAVAGTPKSILAFASVLGDTAVNVDASGLTLHIPNYGFNNRVGVLKRMDLPAECRFGDLVTLDSKGTVPYLVTFDDFTASNEGELTLVGGKVLGSLAGAVFTDDVLAQPVVCGFDQTYVCQEGQASGWKTDLSFDSLRAARLNLDEMRVSNSEVRLINVTSGDEVPST